MSLSAGFHAQLAALVLKPQVNLTRFHGVFAPNSRYCRHVIGEVPLRNT